MSDVPLPVLDPGSRRDLGAEPGAEPRDGRWLSRGLATQIEGEVRVDPHDRMLYATDASIYQVEPLAVVIPRSVADVETTVRFCHDHGVPILPRGGGTSLAGQAVNTAVVIDFSPYCRRLLAVDVAGRTARVEPGLVLDELNHALAPHGLMFGPDVATSTHATLGGMIGNNSAGVHSILYGRTVEHVVGIDAVTADGRRVRFERGAATRDPHVHELTRRVANVVHPVADEIDRRYPRTRRRVNGYNLDLILEQLRRSDPEGFEEVNLAHLLCGSEGTLAVTAAATVGLVDAPAAKGLAIVAFADVDAALAAVGSILELAPAAVELIDDVIIGLARGNLEHRGAVDLLPGAAEGVDPGAVLYVELFADDASGLQEGFDRLESQFGDGRVRTYRDPAACSAAWRLRKAGEPLLHGQPGARKPITFIEDTAVEPEHLPEFIRRFREIVTTHGTTASYYAHASVGCLHIRPMLNLTDDADVDAMHRIVEAVTELVIEYGGALSGEHGDGRLRTHLLDRFYGKPICDAFRAIKAIFDPENRLNPGNITGSPAMDEALRVRPAEHAGHATQVPAVRTYFRYAREHGFAGAVEMCNGAGVCRRTSGGTMCPSYRATRDERHATRGRGNALRLAMTGQLGRGATPAWGDAETLATLDLCLSCKACKRECPSNVDIARLKAEYLAQTYAVRGGAPWSTRVFGRVRSLNRLGSVAPGPANFLARAWPVKAAIGAMLGIDSRRTLPPFARSLHRWFAGRPGAAASGSGPVVVLLADCFTTYNEPHIGRAAVGVLESLGYRVVLPEVGCCGRSMISNGLLAEACRTCARTADALIAAVRRHEAVGVVTCEPSCGSAITDDWLDLELGVDLVKLRDLAERTRSIEAFIAGRWDEHPCRPARAGADPILVHAHCHQKALGEGDAAAGALGRLVDADVRVLDSGCCGMAGVFGYTRDHYDLSMAVGELALFPALRAEPDATIVAAGTSCRHQIRDALGREALHPAEVLARASGR